MFLLLPPCLAAAKICGNEETKLRQCKSNDNIEFCNTDLAVIIFHFVGLSYICMKMFLDFLIGKENSS